MHLFFPVVAHVAKSELFDAPLVSEADETAKTGASDSRKLQERRYARPNGTLWRMYVFASLFAQKACPHVAYAVPTRLYALKYGAKLVWAPEIVDKAILHTERVVDRECYAS